MDLNSKLYRSRKERMIAGVCGGIGVRFGIDPTIVRLVWVLTIFFSFFLSAFIYLLAIIIIPEEPNDIDINYY